MRKKRRQIPHGTARLVGTVWEAHFHGLKSQQPHRRSARGVMDFECHFRTP